MRKESKQIGFVCSFLPIAIIFFLGIWYLANAPIRGGYSENYSDGAFFTIMIFAVVLSVLLPFIVSAVSNHNKTMIKGTIYGIVTFYAAIALLILFLISRA